MTRASRSLILLALLGVAALGPTRARAADAGAPPALPSCVSVRTDARYVPYGYNHVVVLANGCAREVRCLVSTDVTPEARPVDVPVREAREVTTFMGSPSATFVAKVTCTLK